MKKFLRVGLLAILCVTFIGGAALVPKQTQASLGITIPFGGPVLALTPCLNGILVALGPPTPMLIMYPWGALSHLYGPPRNPGQWILGQAVPGGACVLVGFIFNIVIPAQATIIEHGSSVI